VSTRSIVFLGLLAVSGCASFRQQIGDCAAAASYDGKTFHCAWKSPARSPQTLEGRDEQRTVAPGSEPVSLANSPTPVASPRGLIDYMALGHSSFSTSDFQGAVAAFDSARIFAVLHRAIEPELEARTFASLAAGKLKHPREARLRMDSTVASLTKRAAGRRIIANAQAIRAAVYRDTGMPKVALTYFDSARVLFKGLGDKGAQAEMLDAMSDLASQLRRTADAAEYRNAAARLRAKK
jgi:hypothetical protein